MYFYNDRFAAQKDEAMDGLHKLRKLGPPVQNCNSVSVFLQHQ
jgi:hypothetical protein